MSSPTKHSLKVSLNCFSFTRNCLQTQNLWKERTELGEIRTRQNTPQKNRHDSRIEKHICAKIVLGHLYTCGNTLRKGQDALAACSKQPIVVWKFFNDFNKAILGSGCCSLDLLRNSVACLSSHSSSAYESLFITLFRHFNASKCSSPSLTLSPPSRPSLVKNVLGAVFWLAKHFLYRISSLPNMPPHFRGARRAKSASFCWPPSLCF